MNAIMEKLDAKMDSFEAKLDQMLFLKSAKELAAINPEFFNGTLFYSVRNDNHADIIQKGLISLGEYLSEMDDTEYKLSFTAIELNHYAVDFI
jgi:hypothetical protein